MPRTRPDYSREQLELEPVDLPFVTARRTYRFRVNGRSAQKLPVR